MKYYFAYGSNMKHKQIKRRCGEGNVRFLKRAYLPNYKLIFTGHSYTWESPVASVVEKEGAVVWGGLFEINEEAEEHLDEYEGFPEYYIKREVVVYDDEGNSYNALIYIKSSVDGEKVPGSKYLHAILQGAKDCGLPEEYIKELESLLRR